MIYELSILNTAMYIDVNFENSAIIKTRKRAPLIQCADLNRYCMSQWSQIYRSTDVNIGDKRARYTYRPQTDVPHLIAAR